MKTFAKVMESSLVHTLTELLDEDYNSDYKAKHSMPNWNTETIKQTQNVLVHDSKVGKHSDKGDKFVVFRLGTRPTVKGKNAGSLFGMTDFANDDHIHDMHDSGAAVHMIEVTNPTPGDFKSYSMLRGEAFSGRDTQTIGRVIKHEGFWCVYYSFNDLVKEHVLASVTKTEINAYAKKHGYDNFQMNGTIVDGIICYELLTGHKIHTA